MNGLERISGRLGADRGRAIMPFVCAGYPRPGRLGELLKGLEAAGASVIEIGIPFSDPIADGPVIAAAMHEALACGITPTGVLAEVAAVRDEVSLGLVAMVSMSLVERLGGAAGFIPRAASSGFDGFIIPDAPLEESGGLREAAARAGCSLSLLVAPTTPLERVGAIVEACSGFVYLLARAGLTGERGDLPEIGERVQAIRRLSRLPIACGFGISTPAQVRAVLEQADAAIVGSAIVRKMGEAARTGGDPVAAGCAFVRALSARSE